MEMDNSVFAVKLYEMGEQYGKLQCRIRVCEENDRDRIHKMFQKAADEYKENTLLMEEKVHNSRSKAVAKLAEAQLDYRKKTEELMKGPVMEALHSQESSPEQDEEEADMLYAEFAMDFATLAVQQAMLSVLSALDRKNSIDDEKGQNNKEEDTECRKLRNQENH